MTAPRLILINGLIRVAAGAAGQLFAFLLAERLGDRISVGALLVGVISAGYFITELVAAPAAGRLADRHGYIRVLRWGTTLGVLAMLSGALAASEALAVVALAMLLLGARVMEGASAACAVPTTLVLLAQSSAGDAPRRFRVMGVFEITSLLGLIAGFGLAGVAWEALGAGAFLVLPAPYVAAWLLTLDTGSRGERQVTALPPWRGIVTLISRQTSVPFALAWLAVNAVVGVWFQQAPFLLKLPTRSAAQFLVGGYSAATIGLIFMAWGVTFLSGITLWSLFAPRWPRRRILALALGGMLIVVVSLALVNHGASKIVLAVGVLGILIESGFAPAAFAHLADVTDSTANARGAVMGFYAFLLAGGQLAGAALGAPFAARWQMDGVLAITTVLAAVALGGIAAMRRDKAALSR
ncbi:MAG: MFS transporter [Gemmatimonadaceae bacterium]